MIYITESCPRCGMEVIIQVTPGKLRATMYSQECPYCYLYKDGPIFIRFCDINWGEKSEFDRNGYLILKYPVEGWPPE